MCADAPPAPNYQAAAESTAAGNLEAARATAKLSNPSLITPYGTQTIQYGVNGDPDQATVTQSFSPEQQALYNKNMISKGLLADVGISGAESLGNVIGKNVDFSGAPAAPTSSGQTRNDVINAMMGRVDTDTANQREQAQSDLIAAGIRPGTRAYDDKMALIDRGYNDARQQAILAGGQEASRDFSMDSQARKDAIAEILAQRQTPLNEINALMSGAQVTNPFAGQGYQAGATVKGADYLTAANQQNAAANQAYGIESANQNATMAGVATIAAAFI